MCLSGGDAAWVVPTKVNANRTGTRYLLIFLIMIISVRLFKFLGGVFLLWLGPMRVKFRWISIICRCAIGDGCFLFFYMWVFSSVTCIAALSIDPVGPDQCALKKRRVISWCLRLFIAWPAAQLARSCMCVLVGVGRVLSAVTLQQRFQHFPFLRRRRGACYCGQQGRL